MLLIACMHAFRLGSYLNGKSYVLYYSFASDIVLPFGSYFMLVMNEVTLKFLRKWEVKALIVFGAMTFSEVLQMFEIYFFGVTFDPLDILMYAIGTLFAVIFDKLLFPKWLNNWSY
jgi:hypothetical protein